MSDTRLHGPERCPVAPAGCEACSGFHHWLEYSFDPEEDPPDDDERRTQVVAFDLLHGTEHTLGFFGCKHCSAWAEDEYIWDLEEDRP